MSIARMALQVRNGSAAGTLEISHIYLFAEKGSKIAPVNYGEASFSIRAFIADPLDAPDSLQTQFRLPIRLPNMPAGTTEGATLYFKLDDQEATARFRLRLHTTNSYFDFPFRLSLQQASDSSAA
jgi:hypothetical protein